MIAAHTDAKNPLSNADPEKPANPENMIGQKEGKKEETWSLCVKLRFKPSDYAGQTIRESSLSL